MGESARFTAAGLDDLLAAWRHVLEQVASDPARRTLEIELPAGRWTEMRQGGEGHPAGARAAAGVELDEQELAEILS